MHACVTLYVCVCMHKCMCACLYVCEYIFGHTIALRCIKPISGNPVGIFFLLTRLYSSLVQSHEVEQELREEIASVTQGREEMLAVLKQKIKDIMLAQKRELDDTRAANAALHEQLRVLSAKLGDGEVSDGGYLEHVEIIAKENATDRPGSEVATLREAEVVREENDIAVAEAGGKNEPSARPLHPSSTESPSLPALSLQEGSSELLLHYAHGISLQDDSIPSMQVSSMGAEAELGCADGENHATDTSS